MLKPTSEAMRRIKLCPIKISRQPEALLLEDRLALVDRLREMAVETWPDYSDRNPNNPVADMLLAFAARLEREIRDAG